MLASKPARQRIFKFYEQEIVPKNFGDMPELSDLLDKIDATQASFWKNGKKVKDKDPEFRFHTYSPTFGTHSPRSYGIGSIRKAIKNNHQDLSVWVYVNPMFCVKRRDVYGNIRAKWIPYCRKNWVLDIDNSKYDSLQTLLHLFSIKNIAAPNMSTVTSHGSYHLLILGAEGHWESFEARAAFCCRLFDIPLDLVDDQDRLAYELKKHGIDMNYLKQDIGMHKIRLGGSINANKIDATTGKAFICRTYVNPEDDGSAQNYITQKKIDKLKEALKEKPYRWEETIPGLVKLLQKAVGKRYARKWAEIFAENMTLLKRGDYWITQTKVAPRLGIEQPTVSKHLSKMREMHLVETDGKYKYHGPRHELRSMVYRIGQTMVDELFDGENKVSTWNLSKIYDTDGETNWRMMKDIRVMRQLNIDEENMKLILLAKAWARPVHKRPNTRDIQYKINYFKREDRWGQIEGKPKIDVDDLIKRIDQQYAEDQR